MLTKRTFYDMPDSGAPAPAPLAAPAPQSAQALPPPPQDVGKQTVDVQALYHKNYELTSQVNSMTAKLQALEAQHQAKLQENADKISAYDELNAKYTETSETLGKYKEFAQTHLEKRFESLDPVIKEDYKLEDYAESPLKAFGIFDKEEQRIKALQDRLAQNATKGDADPLKGDPNKEGDPAPKFDFTQGATPTDYLRQHEPNRYLSTDK